MEGVRLPALATFIITNRCNLTCSHCYTDANLLKFQEFDTSECLRIIDLLVELPVFQLYIGGGEPTLRQDFLYLLKYAKDAGLTVTTSTNGRFVSESFAKEAPEGVFFQVSIDGPRFVHDQIRGKGSYEAAVRAVRILRSSGHYVSLATVANKLNCSCIKDFYNNCVKELRPSLWHVLRLQPVGRGLRNYNQLGLSNEEWVAVVNWLRSSVKGEPPVSVDSTFDLEGCEKLHQDDAWFYWRDHGVDICIWPNGDITPSDLCLPPYWTFANMRKIRNASEFRRLIRSSELLSSLNTAQLSVEGKCVLCKAYTKCRGGSRIVALTLAHDLRAPDPFCPHSPPVYAYGSESTMPFQTPDDQPHAPAIRTTT